MNEVLIPTGVDEKTPPVARLKSSDLLQSGRELVIEHNGQEYRLIRTSNNKLLLVK